MRERRWPGQLLPPLPVAQPLRQLGGAGNLALESPGACARHGRPRAAVSSPKKGAEQHWNEKFQ